MPIADNWLELIKRGILSSGCDYYLFSSANTDSFQLGSAFTGNLKVMISAPSETGLHPDIIAGRQGAFVADTWAQYEIEAVALTYIVDATFNGRVAYAKDNVWFNVDMGPLPVEQRVFIELDSVLQSHYLLNTPTAFSGYFKAEFDIITFGVRSESGSKIADGEEEGSERMDLNLNGSTNLLDERDYGHWFVDGALTNFVPNDGKMHHIAFERDASDTNQSVKVVGRLGSRVGGSLYFNGVIANPKFTDLSNPANNQTCKLDQATGNTEASQEGNNTITYVNIPESNRELFEFDDATTWNNIAPEPQVLPATIEVAS